MDTRLYKTRHADGSVVYTVHYRMDKDLPWIPIIEQQPPDEASGYRLFDLFSKGECEKIAEASKLIKTNLVNKHEN